MSAKVSPYPNGILAVNGIITMTDTFIGDTIHEILIEIQNKFTFAYLFLFIKFLLSLLTCSYFLPYFQSIIVGY